MRLKISTKKYQKWFITRTIRTFNNSMGEHVVQRCETSNYNPFTIIWCNFVYALWKSWNQLPVEYFRNAVESD